MHRRTVVLLLLLASTAVACDPGYGGGYGRESGGVSQSGSSVITGPPEPPPPPAPPPPTGGFGPMRVTPQRERAKVLTSSHAGGGPGKTCWAEPALTEYALAAEGGKPTRVAAAKDGSVWFSDPATTSVGRLEPSGAVTRYPLPAGRTPGSLAVARDGSVWVVTVGPAIAHLTEGGDLVGYAVPKKQPYRIGGLGDPAPGALTPGPDGAIWFLEIGEDNVGRITSDGKITQYALPDRERMHTHPESMAVGSDGAIWFSENLKGRIGRIAVKTFAITEFPVPPSPAGIGAASVVAGPDGALWFDGGGPAFGRMTTSGDVQLFPLPWQGQYRPNSMTAGPDDRLWFLDSRWGKVVRMTLQGDVSDLPPVADPKGLYAASLEQMTAGPDAVWFAEPEVNRIGRFACRRPTSSDAA